ncbi:MAG: N-acetylneuraminate synthase family protein [Deltaproteobacteria bacterium]|nr:N-acetylneuraminate synthase family protein [Deltaproteobacteria bacterium]
MSKYNFDGLFIFEMANNHQGDLEHGLRIINEVAKEAYHADVRGAFKFQFRDLDTFIHPDHQSGSTNKHIPRFLSTRLSQDQFKTLFDEVRKRGLVTICTPFDETSVDHIVRQGIEIIKIGSCSAKDWPLLEKVSQTGKPVICSTGGLEIADIDKLVSFFNHRGVNFALMHCVSSYPTPHKDLYLNQIETMKNRYSGVPIGFSTHEAPDDPTPVVVAYAKGARLFEKHVAIPTDKHKINSYSATPEQIRKWLEAYRKAVEICGARTRRPITREEEADLNTLKRGVYARTPIRKGQSVKAEDVFFAMPLQEKQLKSEVWREGIIADADYEKNQPLATHLVSETPTRKEIIYSMIHEIKGMLNEAKIPIGREFYIEMSHHYGVERFREFGAILITVINRSYCKKLVIQLPHQAHPNHFHKRKEETFQVLWGELEIEAEGVKKTLYPGDLYLVQAGVWHSFSTRTGVIFEEISTTAFNDDSFYEDKTIASMKREERKTQLENWGRYYFYQENGTLHE